MRWVIIAILAYISIIIERAFFRAGILGVGVDGFEVRPDLLLVLGVFLALHLELHESFIIGWCFGFASDLTSVAGRLGVGAILFCLVLSGIGLLRKNIVVSRVIAQLILCFGAVFVVHGLWYVATQYLEGVSPLVWRSVERAALHAAYSAFLAPYLFWLFMRLRGPLGLQVASAE